MKKDTSVIIERNLTDFLDQINEYTTKGWTVATDSYCLSQTESTILYSVLVQRDVVDVKEDVVNAIKQLHGYACGCVVCRNTSQ